MFWNKAKKQQAKAENPEMVRPAVKPPAPGRNDPCSCGSGKKYKKCCMTKDEAKDREAMEKQWQQAADAAKKKAEKKAKEAVPSAPQSPNVANTPTVTEHRRTTFVPHQVNMPRRSGGG